MISSLQGIRHFQLAGLADIRIALAILASEAVMYFYPYGLVTYKVYTIEELAEFNIVPNPNLWIGNGWIPCPVCQKMTFHKGYSHAGAADQYLVCENCKLCVNRHEISNVPH